MKQILLIFSLTMIISGLVAQETEFYPVERMMTFDEKTATAWTVAVGKDQDDIKKAFVKYCKEKEGIKVKAQNKDHLVAKQVSMSGISANEGDLRAALYSEYGKVHIAVVYFVGYNLAINRNDFPEEMNNLKKFTAEFALYYNTNYYSRMLAESNKRIKKLESELKSGEREITSLNKRINRIEKNLPDTKDENKKFDLTNENVENRARVKALTDVVYNLKEEISRFNASAESSKISLQKLESYTVNY